MKTKRRTFNVKLRLDGVLVELRGVKASDWMSIPDQMSEAMSAAYQLCLMKLTKEYKGMKLDHIDGRPRVVGVETSDAWPE
jgi:hypothetical protein